MRHRTFILLVACLAAALPASALFTRADRNDSEYVELATKYASAVSLGAGGGEGVLISKRWVLTSAHRAQAIAEMKTRPELRIGDRDYKIKAVFFHPQWIRGGTNDIGLLFIDGVVRGVEPTSLYRESDEGDQGVVIVGHGPSGKIGGPELVRDGRARGAINTVNRVEPRRIGLRIRNGDDASDLQGAFTPDETGSPAYIQTKDDLFVVGIAIGIDGEWQNYARVSSYVTWIEQVMTEAQREELGKMLGGAGS
jgi:hypothetical protein